MQVIKRERDAPPVTFWSKLSIFASTAAGIMKTSLLHPGKPLIINKTTGKVDVFKGWSRDV